MPELNPPDPLAAIAARKLIPAKGAITVNEVATKDGDPWYRVEARAEGRAIGAGWVNSNALIGQQLQVLRGVR